MITFLRVEMVKLAMSKMSVFFFGCASVMCICATKMIWFVTSNANQLSVTFIYFSSLETRLFIQEVFVCGRREIIQNIG